MSVLMTLKVPADTARLVEYSRANPGVLKGIVDRAKTFGVISHRFYGSAGTVLVVDEWPDEASFRAFFEASPEIADVMQSAGATGAPEITFWEQLDTGDEL